MEQRASIVEVGVAGGRKQSGVLETECKVVGVTVVLQNLHEVIAP